MIQDPHHSDGQALIETEHDEPAGRTDSSPTARRGRHARTIAIVSIATVLLAGVAVARLHDPQPSAVITGPAPQEVTPGAPHDERTALEQMATDLLDHTVDPEERAELVADGAGARPSASEILRSIDSLRGTSDLTGATVVATRVVHPATGGTIASVDLDVDLARGPVSSVRLTDLVATRVDDAWRFTRGTVCGLAAQAAALGQISTCSDPATPDRIAGDVDLALTLVGDVGDPIEIADSEQVVTGWWGTGVERVGTDWWFVDYPEEELGGGGPVGPADLVRTDSGGRETARVSLAGTDATVVAGDDVIWVAHTVGDPADGSWVRTLTAVDAGSASVLAELGLADTEAAVAGIGDDVVLLDGTLLHVHDGQTLRRTSTVTLPDPYFPDRVRVAPDALWFTNADGHALVVSTADLSMHEVVTAPGELVLSGPNVWAVRDDPAGRGTQVRASAGGDRVIEHLQLGTALG